MLDKKMKLYTIALALNFLSICCVNSITVTEFEQALNRTSYKCQFTFNGCRDLSPISLSNYKNGTLCKIFYDSHNDVYSFPCMVSTGLCSEDEYEGLLNLACGITDIELSVSNYKTIFYSAIDSTSQKCQEKVMTCIISSAIAMITKQANNFCFLMNLNIKNISSSSCLKDACSNAEFNTLQKAACPDNSVVNKWIPEASFSYFIVLTSQNCQEAIEDCAVSSLNAFHYILNQDYCDVMYIKENNVTTKSCLLAENRCQEIDFNLLVSTACVDSDALSKSISKMCVRTILKCISLSNSAQLLYDRKEICEVLNGNYQGVTARQCLVQMGFCKDYEYDLLHSLYCPSPELEVRVSQEVLHFVLDSTTLQCQQNVLDCTFNSIIAALLKTDHQYCPLLHLETNGVSAFMCLKQCLGVEKNWIFMAACNTSLPLIEASSFTKSVMSTSEKCKDFMEICSFGSDLAYSSIQSGQYCKLMNIYQSGAETYACLVGSGGCTDSEYQTMVDAACK